jgi:hypothetical protein
LGVGGSPSEELSALVAESVPGIVVFALFGRKMLRERTKSAMCTPAMKPRDRRIADIPALSKARYQKMSPDGPPK